MPATEETYRRQPTLHVVFALSSLAMLVVIIWMILADHLRSWKEFQRRFQKIEVAKLEKAKEEKQRDLERSKRKELEQIQQQIRAAEDQERKNTPEIDRQEDQV